VRPRLILRGRLDGRALLARPLSVAAPETSHTTSSHHPHIDLGGTLGLTVGQNLHLLLQYYDAQLRLRISRRDIFAPTAKCWTTSTGGPTLSRIFEKNSGKRLSVGKFPVVQHLAEFSIFFRKFGQVLGNFRDFVFFQPHGRKTPKPQIPSLWSNT